MYWQLDGRVLGQRLHRGEPAGDDVDHQLRRPKLLRPLGHLHDLVAVGRDVDGMHHHVPGLVPDAVYGLRHRHHAVLQGAELLIGERLIVLAVGQPSHPGLVDVVRVSLGRQADLRLHDGPDQRFGRPVQGVPQPLYAELGALELLQYGAGKGHVLQPHSLQGLQAEEVPGDDAEDLRHSSDIDGEIIGRECHRGHVAVDVRDLGAIALQYVIVHGRYAGPGAGRLLGRDGYRRLPQVQVGLHLVLAKHELIRVDALAQMQVAIGIFHVQSSVPSKMLPCPNSRTMTSYAA